MESIDMSNVPTESKDGHDTSLHPPHLPEAPGWPIHPAMITSAFELPGFRITRSFGLVRGLTVRSPGFGGSISASFQAMGGGDVQTLRELCEKARGDAFFIMTQDAARYRANAVIGFRYDTTEIGQNLTEVLAYGTAVWAEWTTDRS
jgi:uncharacterized protein YbjQ (UPF0145 family)